MSNISDFTCCVCHKGPQQGITVHRINAKGQPGIWAFEKHIKQTDGRIDPEVKKITDILEGR